MNIIPRWIQVVSWLAVIIKTWYGIMLVARPDFFYPGQTIPPVADSLATRVFPPDFALVIILVITLLKKEARLLYFLLIGLIANEALDAYLAIHDWQQGLSANPVQGAFGPALFAILYLVAVFQLKNRLANQS